MTDREAALETSLRALMTTRAAPSLWITMCGCRPNEWMPVWYKPMTTQCERCGQKTTHEKIEPLSR